MPVRHNIETLLEGFRLPADGARMLIRERQLWPLALVPIGLSILAFGSAGVLVIANAAALYAWATAWMPDPTVSHWFQWLWIGPLLLGLRILGGLLFAAVAGACLVTAYLVASLLAAPFHDSLARRVESLTTGGVQDETQSGVSGLAQEAGRSLLEEARRTGFYLVVVVPLAVVGFLIPPAQLLTGPAIVAFTIFFLPLDYASYTLDRRHVAFAQKRRWALARAPLIAGFGGAAFLTLAIPLLNLIAMPLLVVAGTLLALRHPVTDAGVSDGGDPRAS